MAVSPNPTDDYVVLDATRYTGKPPASTWGAVDFLRIALGDIPDSYDGAPAYIDIGDALELDQRYRSAATVQSKIVELSEFVDAVHLAWPGMRVGLLGGLPCQAGNAVQPPNAATYDAWKQANARLRMEKDADTGLLKTIGRSLASKIDFVCPVLNVIFPEAAIGDWIVTAQHTIAESKKYRKSVYTFLRPRYDPAAGVEGEPYVGDFYFSAMLDTCFSSGAHGVAIYSDLDAGWSEAESTWLPVVSEYIA